MKCPSKRRSRSVFTLAHLRWGQPQGRPLEAGSVKLRVVAGAGGAGLAVHLELGDLEAAAGSCIVNTGASVWKCVQRNNETTVTV